MSLTLIDRGADTCCSVFVYLMARPLTQLRVGDPASDWQRPFNLPIRLSLLRIAIHRESFPIHIPTLHALINN